jgi:hypothetical protein
MKKNEEPVEMFHIFDPTLTGDFMAGYEFHRRNIFYYKWFEASCVLTEDITVMPKHVGVMSLLRHQCILRHVSHYLIMEIMNIYSAK